ncbi:MAG: 3-isopropylmalate dehydratase small subunit, partial [Candidatus Competibacteraceae bacterium]|nr:3-isopropylmalate dehydratase small subunit [Candidatus Competibacteraceae bacterium]
MEPFIQHSGIAIPIDRANVDTDAILPKQYLKSIRKSGYGGWLFDDWRYLDSGDIETPLQSRRPNPEFVLNDPRYRSGRILLARENFG